MGRRRRRVDPRRTLDDRPLAGPDRAQDNRSLIPQMLVTYGLSDRTDLFLSVPYAWNVEGGESGRDSETSAWPSISRRWSRFGRAGTPTSCSRSPGSFRAENLTTSISSDVKLKGFSYYGGAADKDGTLDLGNDCSTILSFEYTLTQNWVTAVDFVYGSSAANAFRSNPGTAP